MSDIPDVRMSVCRRGILCADCDDKNCWHAGEMIADCPMPYCDREGDLLEDCKSCALMRDIRAGYYNIDHEYHTVTSNVIKREGQNLRTSSVLMEKQDNDDNAIPCQRFCVSDYAENSLLKF